MRQSSSDYTAKILGIFISTLFLEGISYEMPARLFVYLNYE